MASRNFDYICEELLTMANPWLWGELSDAYRRPNNKKLSRSQLLHKAAHSKRRRNTSIFKHRRPHETRQRSPIGAFLCASACEAQLFNHTQDLLRGIGNTQGLVVTKEQLQRLCCIAQSPEFMLDVNLNECWNVIIDLLLTNVRGYAVVEPFRTPVCCDFCGHIANSLVPCSQNEVCCLLTAARLGDKRSCSCSICTFDFETLAHEQQQRILWV
mmetsp:Transcript_49819/g.77807  ORF Transcript_49819/g.77807 Transcript_49819/m.77807 type:complete len:214 (+) Transcript_49819:44-685(+)